MSSLYAITIRMPRKLARAVEAYRRFRQETTRIPVSKQRALIELVEKSIEAFYRAQGWILP